MRLSILPLFAALLVAASPLEDRASLRALQQLDQKVASIAHALAVANAPRCPAKEAATGLLFHALGQYAPSERDAARAEFGARARVTLLAVVPGSAAARAGLQEGDELTWINRVAVAIPALPPRASYDSVARVEDDIMAALSRGPAEIMFVRTGFERSATLDAVPACPARTVVVPDRKLQAWADGIRVSLTTALAARTRDDAEIAFILAHEMSHNILRHDWEHAPKPDRNALARMAEDEADRMGVEMMAAAGFDPMAAARFIAREGRKFDHPGLKRRTHLPWAERVRFLTAIAAPMRPARPAQ